MYRNPAILRMAKDMPCQFCFVQDGTVVAAHSNQGRHGKGMAQKAHDCFVAYLCHGCHHEIDQGKDLGKRAKQQLWEIAHQRSVPLFVHLLGEEGTAVLEGDGYGWEGLLR